MSNHEARRPRRLFVSASVFTATSLCAAVVLGVGADKIEAYSEAVSIATPQDGEAASDAQVSSSADQVFVARPVVQTVPEDRHIAVDPDVPLPVAEDVSEAEVLCLAKIVHHESASQPEQVQYAVANVVLNRKASGRFPATICGVAHQRGQFFNVDAYHPESDPRWATSQRIAEEAIAGEGSDAAPGALFFRTASYSSTFFRSRPQVAVLGAMAFHR